MLIHEMTEGECAEALERARVGRLACARHNEPYIVPIYFAYRGRHLYGVHLAGRHLYGFATLGQKIEWMRENPRVCVETDEVTSHDRWVSVVISGRYEELPDTPEFAAARVEAHELLGRHPMWWEPGYVATARRDPTRPLTPVYYRVGIERVTGHRATPDGAGAPAPPAARGGGRGWLHDILHPARDRR